MSRGYLEPLLQQSDARNNGFRSAFVLNSMTEQLIQGDFYFLLVNQDYFEDSNAMAHERLSMALVAMAK